MDNQTLVIIVLGLFGVVALAVIAYIEKTRAAQLGELGALFTGLLEKLVQEADVALEPYGEQLKPAHEALTYLKQQVDEPTDWLIKQLAARTGTPATDIIAVLTTPIQYGMDLTDGLPATPPSEPEQGEPGGTAK